MSGVNYLEKLDLLTYDFGLFSLYATFPAFLKVFFSFDTVIHQYLKGWRNMLS